MKLTTFFYVFRGSYLTMYTCAPEHYYFSGNICTQLHTYILTIVSRFAHFTCMYTIFSDLTAYVYLCLRRSPRQCSWKDTQTYKSNQLIRDNIATVPAVCVCVSVIYLLILFITVHPLLRRNRSRGSAIRKKRGYSLRIMTVYFSYALLIN